MGKYTSIATIFQIVFFIKGNWVGRISPEKKKSALYFEVITVILSQKIDLLVRGTLLRCFCIIIIPSLLDRVAMKSLINIAGLAIITATTTAAIPSVLARI